MKEFWKQYWFTIMGVTAMVLATLFCHGCKSVKPVVVPQTHNEHHTTDIIRTGCSDPPAEILAAMNLKNCTNETVSP